METLVLKIPLLPTLTVQVERTEKKSFHPDSKRVFIVHGHDTAIRSQVELFIKTLGYRCPFQTAQCRMYHHVEFPGYMSGIVYVSFDDKGAWQIAVAKEMKAAGLDVDLNKLA